MAAPDLNQTLSSIENGLRSPIFQDNILETKSKFSLIDPNKQKISSHFGEVLTLKPDQIRQLSTETKKEVVDKIKVIKRLVESSILSTNTEIISRYENDFNKHKQTCLRHLAEIEKSVTDPDTQHRDLLSKIESIENLVLKFKEYPEIDDDTIAIQLNLVENYKGQLKKLPKARDTAITPIIQNKIVDIERTIKEIISIRSAPQFRMVNKDFSSPLMGAEGSDQEFIDKWVVNNLYPLIDNNSLKKTFANEIKGLKNDLKMQKIQLKTRDENSNSYSLNLEQFVLERLIEQRMSDLFAQYAQGKPHDKSIAEELKSDLQNIGLNEKDLKKIMPDYEQVILGEYLYRSISNYIIFKGIDGKKVEAKDVYVSELANLIEEPLNLDFPNFNLSDFALKKLIKEGINHYLKQEDAIRTSTELSIFSPDEMKRFIRANPKAVKEIEPGLFRAEIRPNEFVYYAMLNYREHKNAQPVQTPYMALLGKGSISQEPRFVELYQLAAQHEIEMRANFDNMEWDTKKINKPNPDKTV